MFRRNFAQKSPRKILPKPAAEQDPPPGPSTTSSTTLEPTGALLAHSAPPQQSPEEGPESQPEEAENNLISSPASQSLKGKSPEALHQSIETSNAPDSDQNIDPTLDSLRSSARPLIRSMSQRSRPRSGPVKDEADTHEETAMWNQISKDLGKLSVIQKRQIEVTEQIKKKEVENKELDEAKKLRVKDVDELSDLYRELLKLSAEENRALTEEPTDLIRNVDILKALSEATTATREAPSQRSSAPSKVRKQKSGRGDVDGAADSPGPSGPSGPSGHSGPSPSVQVPRMKGSSVRSGSVASTRDSKDSTIKSEESVLGTNGFVAERAGLFVEGADVAYKQAKPKEDGGQWIQCTITSVVEVGNKKQYRVQDPEPDENGAPGATYKANASNLMAIPQPGAQLLDYSVGKFVLARYPETTTFYRAEVMGLSKDTYRLKFEDDANQEMSVDRRFVLDLPSR